MKETKIKQGKEILNWIHGVPFPQVGCWRGGLVRWSDVQVLEQSLHILVFLVLLLFGGWPSRVP
jgi:hypothetical protein